MKQGKDNGAHYNEATVKDRESVRACVRVCCGKENGGVIIIVNDQSRMGCGFLFIGRVKKSFLFLGFIIVRGTTGLLPVGVR